MKLGFCMLKPSAGVSWLGLPALLATCRPAPCEWLNLPAATLVVVHFLNGCKILRFWEPSCAGGELNSTLLCSLSATQGWWGRGLLSLAGKLVFGIRSLNSGVTTHALVLVFSVVKGSLWDRRSSTCVKFGPRVSWPRGGWGDASWAQDGCCYEDMDSVSGVLVCDSVHLGLSWLSPG